MINDQLNSNCIEQQLSTERTGVANQGSEAVAQGCVATFNTKRASRTIGTHLMAGERESLLSRWLGVSESLAWCEWVAGLV